MTFLALSVILGPISLRFAKTNPQLSIVLAGMSVMSFAATWISLIT